jgi:hypothetical protein
MPRIRMCDADREKYGGDEWLELEAADILDEETGVIEQIEEAWGMSPAEFLHGVTRGTVKAVRALIWVARWKQGMRDNPRTFRPRTQEFSGVQVEYTARETARSEEIRGSEADPPANRAERRAARTPRKAASTARSKRSSTGTGSGSSAS